MISVLIPTKDEASDLPGCLGSLKWCDDVHVFDSLSTDGTLRIAAEHGARTWSRKFDGYASQKNAALTTLPFKYEWVLMVDADERVPAALVREMMEFVATADDGVVAARIRRRDFLFGKWLKHAQISPWYLRLVRPHRVHFEREVNEVLIPHGKVAELIESFNHYPFSKGIAHWVEKHNKYSSMEAQRALDEIRGAAAFSLRKALLSRDFNERRFHQKGLFYRLPGRPLIKLCYMLFVRRAVLDGGAGWVYSMLQAFYEYLIVLKQIELRFNARERVSSE